MLCSRVASGRSALGAVVAVVWAAATMAGPAGAATIGGTGPGIPCSSREFIDLGPQSTVQPSQGGVITSFHYRSSSGDDPAVLDFNVLRRVAGFDYRVVGRTGPTTDPSDGTLRSVPANIAVQPGDHLGVYVATAGWPCLREQEGSLVAFAPADSDPAPGDVLTTENEFDELALNLSATIEPGAAPAVIAGSGISAFGAPFAIDVRGTAGAPTGTASLGSGEAAVSGRISCLRFRDDGRDGTFGRRAVFGIKLAGSRPRYVEYYVQAFPGANDRIVRTGTTPSRRYVAPPPTCYHDPPLSLQAINRISSGNITITGPS